MHTVLIFAAFAVALVLTYMLTWLLLAPLWSRLQLRSLLTTKVKTQFYISDLLVFIVQFGLLAAVIARGPELNNLATFAAFLLPMFGMWYFACYVLSRLGVHTFWPRAVGITLFITALLMALILSFSLIFGQMPSNAGIFGLWAAGFVISVILSRLGSAYILRHVEVLEGENLNQNQ